MTTVRPTTSATAPVQGKRPTRRAVVAGSVALATTIATRTAGITAAQPAPTATMAGEEAVVGLYFLGLEPNRLGPQLRPWAAVVTVDPADRRVATATLELLLAGPDDDVRAGGGVTAIPDGVRLLSADLVEDGLVRVGLSGDFLDTDIIPELADRLATPAAGQNRSAADRVLRLRQAQIVFTLTRFETITGVDLRVDGQPAAIVDFLGNAVDGPATRDAFEDVIPLILIERPLPLETVGSSFAVSGSSNTFEGGLFLRLITADGDTLLDQPVQATSGSGARGTFSAELAVPDGTESGTITLLGYELSARDGSEVNAFEVSLRFADVTAR